MNDTQIVNLMGYGVIVVVLLAVAMFVKFIDRG